jgi:transcriptional regulator with XRE-family HTH domain
LPYLVVSDNIQRMPRKKPLPPPPELLTLPGRLRYARERSGLTATAVAERSKIDLSQISRFEREARPGIEAATIIRLAEALGVPVGWLAADEGQLPPAPIFRESSDRRRRRKPDSGKPS